MNKTRKYKRVKKCNWCDKKYTASKSDQQFCSVKCKSANKRNSKVMSKICVICGIEFNTTYHHKKTCSYLCLNRNRLNHFTKYKIYYGKYESKSIVPSQSEQSHFELAKLKILEEEKETEKEIREFKKRNKIITSTHPMTNPKLAGYKCVICNQYGTWKNGGTCWECQQIK